MPEDDKSKSRDFAREIKEVNAHRAATAAALRDLISRTARADAHIDGTCEERDDMIPREPSGRDTRGGSDIFLSALGYCTHSHTSFSVVSRPTFSFILTPLHSPSHRSLLCPHRSPPATTPGHYRRTGGASPLTFVPCVSGTRRNALCRVVSKRFLPKYIPASKLDLYFTVSNQGL